MLSALRLLAAIAGALLVLGTFHGLIVTLVMPRRFRRLEDTDVEDVQPRRRRGRRNRIAPSRVASALWYLVSRAFEAASRLSRHRWVVRRAGVEPLFLAEDRVLGFLGPVSLLTLFAAWFALLVLGFSLIAWGTAHGSFGAAVRLIGSSVLTLGVVAPSAARDTVLCYLSAASGLVALALEIGYLPTIHGHYTRRESMIRMLEARAGQPAWGPEVLVRQHRVKSLHTLAELYAAWEVWTADVLEAHLTFPWLMLFRSSEPEQSWITSLLAVLDSAAMYLALCPTTAPNAQARQCLRMGFTALRRLADALNLEHDEDPRPDDPIELPRERFDEAVAYLESFSFPVERTAGEAWPHFRGWRVNYESVAYALVQLLHAPPARWSGSVDEIDTHRPLHRTPENPEGR